MTGEYEEQNSSCTDLNRQSADYKSKFSNFSNPLILVWFPVKS
jgi:hypothetical protein